ncbi:MAG: DUF559 domain-containing protein [Saprospiraceae bacterium]|nr:DUF559 domain-containing protein [Saprospiraceae bacterium]
MKYARDHRKNPTQAEKFGWDKIRNKKFYGLKFNVFSILCVIIQEFQSFQQK